MKEQAFHRTKDGSYLSDEGYTICKDNGEYVINDANGIFVDTADSLSDAIDIANEHLNDKEGKDLQP